MAEQAGEKTEAPSARRLAEARRKGEVAYSRDLTGAAVFVSILAILSLSGASLAGGLLAYLRTAIVAATRTTHPTAALEQAAAALMAALRVPLCAAFAIAILVGGIQSGWVFSWQSVGFDFKRVLPKLGRVVRGSAFAEIAKGFGKIGLAGTVAWFAVRPLLRPLLNLTGASPVTMLAVTGLALARLGRWLSLVAVLLAVADFLWQRRQHLQRLRMTREEVKREQREQEGDPHHKAERLRLHRQLLEQRMLADVRKADFVVVNPDHIAVAIRYDKTSKNAPQVIAKGERLLAERIKEAAREAGIPIFRDVSLARALRGVEEGDEIPEALYEAVAEILRVVYAPVTATTAAPGANPNDKEKDMSPKPRSAFWTRA